MTRTDIGGDLDLDSLANLHRRKTVDEMRVAVVELAGRGYSDLAIAQSLALSVEAVRRMIGDSAQDAQP